MAERDVAVIVVTYKSAELTVDCLRSVARERADKSLNIRCVVVDNASGDAPRVRAAVEAEGWSDWADVLVADRNGGFAYGNNVGIHHAFARARPEFVHLLNPDTVLHPGAIAALVRFMDATPKAGIVGGIFENGDASEWAIAFRFPTLASELEGGMQLGAVSRLLRRWQVPMQMGAQAREVDWVSGASMLMRSEVVERIGDMDEGFFLYFEETEFCFRAKQAGYQVWYTPDSRVTHIAGQSTKVTERNVAPRRLPTYWFESRRRYFALTHGVGYAMLADLVAVAAGSVGEFKRLVTGRRRQGVPAFLRDLLANSYLMKRNRAAALVGVARRAP
jgi:N-acetylglucosaminyl-diphospho-decaprenol L-rhamnosyltransferase